MRERTSISIIVLVLIILGILSIFAAVYLTKFNFYRSEISISGNQIQETLYFKPDQDYHTLFRNFVNPIYPENDTAHSDYITIKSVECQQGTAYLRTNSYLDIIYFGNTNREGALSNTENNEYGCGFGEELGFTKGNNYWIKADYELHPSSLFEIQGRHYIKFVAYSQNEHKLLIKNNNFVIRGDGITKNFFMPSQYAIIYIPYEPADLSAFTIIPKNSFEFESNSKLLIIILLAFLPAFIFFIVWFIFGREKSFADLPSSLSYYPEGRKAWEIAVYFNPPFGEMSRNFFPTMVLDMYRREVIDIKETNKEIYIKIKDYSDKKLDEIETYFMKLLEKIRDLGNKKYIDEQGYFNLEKSSNSIGFFKKDETVSTYKAMQKQAKEASKKIIDYKGNWILDVLLIVVVFFLLEFFVSGDYFYWLVLLSISLIIGRLIAGGTALMIRFKNENYKEYQNWQAFKNYLKAFPSMREAPPQAVVMWEQYLVYATALGVEGVVINKLRDWGIITAEDHRMFKSIYATSLAVSSSPSTNAGGGGGFGGAAMGGVGGGGGGGR